MKSIRAVTRRRLLQTAAAIPILGKVTPTAGAAADSDSDHRRLRNEHVELRFNKGGELVKFHDRQRNVRLVDSETTHGAWELILDHPDHDKVTVPATDAGDVAVEEIDDGSDAGLRLTYRNVPMYGDNGQLSTSFEGPVTVEVRLPANNPLSYWRASVTNTTDLAIRQVVLPRLFDIGPLAADGSDALIVPNQLGRRIPDPTSNADGATHRYPTGYGSMQFTAYLGEDSGLYVDTRDTNGHVKNLRWAKQYRQSTLKFGAKHKFPKRPGADITLSYPTTLGPVGPSWYDAADRYRSWIETTDWLKEDVTAPQWVSGIGGSHHLLSYSLPGRPEEDHGYAETARWVKRYRDVLGTPLQFFWLGWETRGYPGTGDWFPPKEGREAFDETIQSLAEQDIDTVGWLNVTQINGGSELATKRPDAVENWTITSEDGSLATSTDRYTGETIYRTEFAHPQYQRVIREVSRKLVNSGVTELVMDGFPWGRTPACHDPSHDHPPGRGGNWFSTAVREYLLDLKDDLSNGRRPLALSGEGFSDFYMPVLDVYNTRDVMAENADGPESPIGRGAAELLPLVPYVYSDVLVTRTKNHTPYDLGTDDVPMLRLCTARALTWGALPMFRIRSVPDNDDAARQTVDYLRRVVQARARYANRFIADGRMLPGPTYETPQITVTAVEGTTYQRDAVHASTWQDANGAVGVVATSITEQETRTRVEVSLAQADDALPSTDNRLTYVVANGEYKHHAVDDTRVDLELNGEDVVLVVVETDNQERRTALDAIIAAQDAIDEEAPPDEAERQLLAEAKRAFERRETRTAHETAIEARQAAARTPTSTQTKSRNHPSSRDSSKTSTAETSVSDSTPAQSPGFGLAEVIAASTIGELFRRLKRRDDE